MLRDEAEEALSRLTLETGNSASERRQNPHLDAGVSQRVANAALRNVSYDEKAIRFSRSQPEYRTPIWDYMAFLVDEKRRMNLLVDLTRAWPAFPVRPEPDRQKMRLKQTAAF